MYSKTNEIGAKLFFFDYGENGQQILKYSRKKLNKKDIVVVFDGALNAYEISVKH